MDFETHLLNGIPQAEAADFFIRIRGKNKEASVADLVDAFRGLPADEQELLKAAMGPQPMPGPAPLAPTGKGMNMAPAQPMPLPPSATGQQAAPGMKMGAAADKSPEETGKERATAALSAEFEKEKHHTHESNRNLVGHLGGAALGAAVGHKLKGNATSKVLATLAGSHLGGQAGKHSGQAADRKDWEKKHADIDFALPVAGGYLGARKGDPSGRAGEGMAKGTLGTMLGGAVGHALGSHAASRLGHEGTPKARAAALLGQLAGGYGGYKGMTRGVDKEKKAAAFKLALEQTGLVQPQQQGIVPQLDPATQQLLEMQQMGDQAAEQNETAFLREKLQAAQQEAQAASTQAQQLQASQDQHDAQMAQIQAQVADSTQKAMSAQDQVLQGQQAAAAMRMAFQQLRGTLLEAASQEPPSLTPTPATDAAAQQASQAAGPNSAPSPTTGPAGDAPSPGTAPGSPAPQGDDQVTAPSAGNEPMFGTASPTTSVGQQEPTGDAKMAHKEVLSHFLPFGFAPEKTAALRDFLMEHGREALKVAPHAAVGALTGAGIGLGEALTSNAPLRQKVQDLEARPDRGVRDTLNLAQSRARLTVGDFAQEHPGLTAGAGALGGALLGATKGPAAVGALQRSAGHIAGIGRDMKTILSKGAA